METWMERMAHEGYKQAAIIDALKCTSLRPDLAEYVLLEIKNGRALPRDVPGVWSESDDRILQGCDARRLRALEEKHGGWSALDQRREFLEGYS
jgi:telomeric repeat-binding factor 2-interacting protein 1